MAELQTLAAVLELANIAREVSQFLWKVKNADKFVSQAQERITRLRGVLDGVKAAVERRQFDASSNPHDVETIQRIEKCVAACTMILRDIKQRTIGNGVEVVDKALVKKPAEDDGVTVVSLLERVRVAFKQPGTLKRQADLEARITALQTELALLQLSGQAHTDQILGANHKEVLLGLSALGDQLTVANRLLKQMLLERETFTNEEFIGPTFDDDDEDALESLSHGLIVAERFRVKVATEYSPDDRSQRDKIYSRENLASPPVTMTPMSRPQTPTSRADSSNPGRYTEPLSTVGLEAVENLDDDCLDPPEMIEKHIQGYVDRAYKEMDSGRFQQAEWNLSQAIGYAQIAESKYGVPFKDRHQRQEELAVLYQKQHKLGEAVRIVSKLVLEEGGDEHSYARQHQLLASIYHDRHLQRSASLSYDRNDIQIAHNHAMKAYNRRFSITPTKQDSPETLAQHQSCIELLVRILKAQERVVEAKNYEAMLTDSEGSIMSSRARTSFSNSSVTPASRDLAPVDSHKSLVTAIKENNVELVKTLLSEGEVDVDRPCRHDLTPLMYAVEFADESTAHSLLDPEVGADVNAQNRKGVTAMHRAAELGRVNMIMCLLKYDADIHVADKARETALTKAIKKDRRSVIRILEARDANVDAKGFDDWSLLHYAVKFSSTETIDLVLNIAPSLKDAVDNAGMTALHHCAADVLLDQAKTLLVHKNKLDPNAIDSISRSPLYFVASHPPTPKREDMVSLLLKYGAHLDKGKDRLPPRMRDFESLNSKSVKIPSRQDSGTSLRGQSTNESILILASSWKSRWNRFLPNRKHTEPDG